jgi:hypothetical protein
LWEVQSEEVQVSLYSNDLDLESGVDKLEKFSKNHRGLMEQGEREETYPKLRANSYAQLTLHSEFSSDFYHLTDFGYL